MNSLPLLLYLFANLEDERVNCGGNPALGMWGALRTPALERGKRTAVWSPPLTRRGKLCCAWRSEE